MKTWICEGCGIESEYDSGWSNEDAIEEAKKNGLYLEDTPVGLLCDECYESFLNWFKRQWN